MNVPWFRLAVTMLKLPVIHNYQRTVGLSQYHEHDTMSAMHQNIHNVMTYITLSIVATSINCSETCT